MLTFDRDSLTRRLKKMSTRSRTAFALACSERLMPLYEAYSSKSARGDWRYLRSMTDDLWEQLSRGDVCPDREWLAKYPSLAPGDDTPRSERTILDPLAENAVLALGSAWECHVSGDSEKAFWAAEQAYEAIDYMAQNVEGIDYREAGGEESLRQSPFVQHELRRQLDDLTMLEQVNENDTEYLSLLAALRERARIDGQTLRTTVELL